MKEIKVNKKFLTAIITIVLLITVCSIVIILCMKQSNTELGEELNYTTQMSVAETSTSNGVYNEKDNKASVIDTNYIGDDTIVQYDVVNNVTTYHKVDSSQNSGACSTEPYIPDGMQIANPNEEPKVYASDIKSNRDPNKVTMEIKEGTLTNRGATIIITDENETEYGWGKGYKIQKKVNNNWTDLEPLTDLVFESIAYLLDENNQLEQKIDWTRFYGELDKGQYKIVKSEYYDGKYVDFYVEFTID